MLEVLAIYVLINAVGFWMMGNDKQRARKKQFRISEGKLWAAAFIGGALGMTVGMKVFRHKTRHFQFKWGLPLLGVVQVFTLLYWL